MKKHIKKFLLSGGAAMVGTLVILFLLRVGPSRDHIQAEARESQHIKSDWLAVEDSGGELAALVFYPEAKDHTAVFSLYRKDRVPFFGWHFRAGGGIWEIDRGVAELDPEGCSERAYVSLNAPGICKAELGSGETVALDPEEPFALVLPRSAGAATFYDGNGNVVESARCGM